MFQYSRHELRKFVGRRSAIGVTDAHTTKVPIMLAFQAVYFIYISALFSSKNSSCTLNYCVFSGILMNEIWCLFLPCQRQGADLTWPRLSVFTSMTRTLKTKFRTSTSIYILIDNLPQKFPFVNNLHICFSKINSVL